MDNDNNKNNLPWWKRWPRNARQLIGAGFLLTGSAPLLSYHGIKIKLAQQGPDNKITACEERFYQTFANAASVYARIGGSAQLGLALAIDYSDIEKARHFLKKGADVNFKGEINVFFNENWAVDQPLMTAIETPNKKSPEKQTAMAVLLLNAGANPNISDDETGDTPLHHAVTHKNSDLVRLLLEKGAESDALNKDNETPLDRAKEGHLLELVNILEEWPAIKERLAEEAAAALCTSQLEKLNRLLPKERKSPK